MSNILDGFVAVAPYINQLTNNDVAISVCDLEKCLIYVPSEKQDHKLKVGSPHHKNSVAYQSIISGERVIRRVDSNAFGFPYIAFAVPIRDEYSKIIGTVVFSEAVDRQDILLNSAENLHSTMQQMLSITESISENSIMLKDVGESLSYITEESLKRVNATEGILGFIENISNKTNMLGLNAAIEAARVGKEGNGFMVVAQEIRNLAKATNEYIKNGDKIIEELRESTSKITEKLNELLSISSNQIDINNDIKIIVEEINDRAEKLKENAQLLNE